MSGFACSVGKKVFPTKAAFRRRVQQILHGAKDGAVLTGEDLDTVLGALRNHPRCEQKVGPGVRAVRVRYRRAGPRTTLAPCFTLERVDGSEVSFSYLKCFKRNAKRAGVIAAFRNEIAPDVLAYKRQYFDHDETAKRICPLSGSTFRFETADVHHEGAHTFMELVDSFLAHHNLQATAVELSTGGESGSHLDTIRDETMAERWRKFHEQEAVLRVVSRAGHSRLGDRTLRIFDETAGEGH